MTGDPNIPRGEVTWVADDISDKGLVRYGEKDWPGARIVKSRGQIANQGYKNRICFLSHTITQELLLTVDSKIYRNGTDNDISRRIGTALGTFWTYLFLSQSRH